MDETIEYKGYTIKIEQDTDAESPRDWDNLGTMIYKHRNCILGDEEIPDYYYTQEGNENYIENFEDIKAWVEDKHGAIAVILPLYVYEHGGITMRTSSFSDRWDSGQAGYIFVTKEKLREEYSVKRITKKILEQAEKILEGEVETFDDYLTGSVYGYSVEETDDSCWGFFGDSGREEAISQAKDAVNYAILDTEKAKEQKTKKYIRGNVPLIYRQ